MVKIENNNGWFEKSLSQLEVSYIKQQRNF